MFVCVLLGRGGIQKRGGGFRGRGRGMLSCWMDLFKSSSKKKTKTTRLRVEVLYTLAEFWLVCGSTKTRLFPMHWTSNAADQVKSGCGLNMWACTFPPQPNFPDKTLEVKQKYLICLIALLSTNRIAENVCEQKLGNFLFDFVDIDFTGDIATRLYYFMKYCYTAELFLRLVVKSRYPVRADIQM